MTAREWSSFYASKGLTIIPLAANGKIPILRDWQNRPREELFNACLNHGGNVGIRIERPVFVIDVDDKRLARLFLDELAANTWAVETRRGIHIYLKVSDEVYYPQNNKKSKWVQLLAEGSQVVAPPSVVNGWQYRFISGPECGILEVDQKTLKRLTAILTALEKHEALIMRLAEHWDEGHRHNLSLWLNGALRKAGVEKAEAAVIVKSICLLAQDPELHDRLEALKTTYERPIDDVGGISYLREELIRIVGPAEAERILSLLPAAQQDEEKIEERKKTRYCVGGEKIGDALIEVVAAEGPMLLVWIGEKFEVKPELEINGEILRPYPDLPFSLPGAPSNVGEDPTLWNDTKKFIMEYFDSPADEKVYDVLVAAVAWSYFVQDIRGSTPYLLFLGPWRSGKTRALETLAMLCYKSTFLIDPSEASLFRMIESFRPTLLIDESQILDPNVRAVVAAGYRWGAKVPRVIDPEADGLDGIRFFDVFGLKLYASREQPPDDIYSRSIVIHCERNLRPTAKKIDMEKATELRTRWLAQKLRMLGKIDITYEEFASDDGRIQELFSPLVKMAELFADNSTIEKIVEYGRSIEAEIKGLEGDTPEADVLQALISIIQESTDDAPELVAVSAIVERLNNGDPHGSWTPEKVGRKLSTLGFRRTRLPDGKRAYLINYALLGRLALRYRIDMDLKLLQRVEA